VSVCVSISDSSSNLTYLTTAARDNVCCVWYDCLPWQCVLSCCSWQSVAVAELHFREDWTNSTAACVYGPASWYTCTQSVCLIEESQAER